MEAVRQRWWRRWRRRSAGQRMATTSTALLVKGSTYQHGGDTGRAGDFRSCLA